MILSFEDYIIEEYNYSLFNKEVRKVEKEEYKIPNNYKLFFKERNICPSCKKKTSTVHSDHFSYHIDTYYTFVNECSDCGWWQIQCEFEVDYDGFNPPSGLKLIREEKLFHALVKKFKVEDYKIPLNTLFLELAKSKSLLFNIHPTKMEELCQEVLKDFFDCDVYHVGKSGDGGKDLILIVNDEKILVQVKRRTKPDAVESISTIRDILGTLFIENSKKGMIVSTAQHFSKQSILVKNQLLRNHKLDYFELVDFKRFCEMLDLVKKTKVKPWERIIQVDGWANETRSSG